MRLKTQFKAAEQSAGFLLWKASNRLQRLHGRCLADLDVTPTQFSLMTCLVYLHQNGPVTSARIVAHSGMDKMLVSDLVAGLQKKRLLTRAANAADGRSWLIEPTPRGFTLTNSAVAKIEALDALFFKPVKNLRVLQKDLLALTQVAVPDL
jgi:MarR family transcriptional regulator, organic hydroperoxide resistance regulator